MTATGVKPSGGRKMYPRISSIVQILFLTFCPLRSGTEVILSLHHQSQYLSCSFILIIVLLLVLLVFESGGGGGGGGGYSENLKVNLKPILDSISHF